MSNSMTPDMAGGKIRKWATHLKKIHVPAMGRYILAFPSHLHPNHDPTISPSSLPGSPQLPEVFLQRVPPVLHRPNPAAPHDVSSRMKAPQAPTDELWPFWVTPTIVAKPEAVPPPSCGTVAPGCIQGNNMQVTYEYVSPLWDSMGLGYFPTFGLHVWEM